MSGCFVTMKTEETLLINLEKLLIKIHHFKMWINKSEAYLNQYLDTLDQIENEPDSVKKGHLIASLEAYFMTSVSLFYRCFLTQHGMHLKFKDVSKDAQLQQWFKAIETLRHDEFVHWKGLSSSISLKYSFSCPGENQVEFAKELQVNYSYSLGPPTQKSGDFRAILKATSDHLQQKEQKTLADLRTALSKTENWKTTNFLNKNGEPIIKRS